VQPLLPAQTKKQLLDLLLAFDQLWVAREAVM
jgi:hypothetical protein